MATAVVILAAGSGSRVGAEVNKVLLPLLTSITAPTPGYAQSPGQGQQQPQPPPGDGGNQQPGGPPGSLKPLYRRPNLGLWRIGRSDRP